MLTPWLCLTVVLGSLVNMGRRVVGESQVLWRIPMTDVSKTPCSPRGSPFSSMFASKLPLMMAPLDVQMVAVSCDDALGAAPCLCHGVELTTINRIYGSGPFLGDYRDSLALDPHLLFSSVCLENGHAHRVWGLYSIIPPPPPQGHGSIGAKRPRAQP